MKSNRHAMILRLIEENAVDTQEQLAELLKQAGIQATQATISRDIKELRLSKVLSDNGTYRYAVMDRQETGITDRMVRIFAASVVSFAAADNLIVVKTLSGSANAAAELIDSLGSPDIAGTLAGDNTIFVAVKSCEKVPGVMQLFQEMLSR